MSARTIFAFRLAQGAAAALALAISAVPAAAQECPTWSFTGTIDTGDGSTMPGDAVLWVSDTPAPHGSYGVYSQGETITISGGGNVGNYEKQWYAISGGYFWSPITGSIKCTRQEGAECGTCTGGFGIKLYATQGALHGSVTVIPEREEGLAGIPVWMSRDLHGGTHPTYTDEDGHYEFRATGEPDRSNNWGVGVDGYYDPWPHSGNGMATYFVGSGDATVVAVVVSSSQLAQADLVIGHPRVEEPEMRDPCAPPGAGGDPPSPPGSAGKPVNLITGNVFFDHLDVNLPGVAGLSFVRSYNSKNAYNDLDSSFSRGWTHSYSRALTFPDSISIDFRGDDGVPLYYQDVDGDGIYDAALPATERTRVVVDGERYRREIPGGAHEVYDAAGRLTSIVDESGNVIRLERDSGGKIIKVSDPGGRFLSFHHDDRGRIASLSAGNTIVAAYEYDENHFLQKVAYPDGSGYVFTYDERGQVLRVEDASGRAIESHEYGSYDTASFGLTSEIADGQEKLSFTYEPWKTTVTDADGNSTVYDWRWVHGLRQIVKITGPCTSCASQGAHIREWTYDDVGRIVQYRENEDTPSSYTYDAEGRLATATDPAGRVTSYTYDEEDRLRSVATPGGGLITTTYGVHGPESITEKVSESSSRTTTLAYTSRGQTQTITDPQGSVVTQSYDLTGDLLTVTDPMGNVTSFTYDDLGRRSTVTDALGHTTSLTRDARGRILRITRPDGTYSEFTYDPGGRRTAATDALGRTTRYVYDLYGRLVEMADPAGGVTGFGYDSLGRLRFIKNPNRQTTAFEYGARDLVTKTTYPGGAFESFEYDAHGRLRTRIDRNGVATSYSYDILGRLIGTSYSDGTPSASFTYDSAGRLASAANGSDTVSWTYDLAGQLESESSAGNGSTVSYTYDLVGNPVTVSLDDELFASSTYDAASRLTAMTTSTTAVAFTYDAANRRVSTIYPNGVATGYARDALGRTTDLDVILGVGTAVAGFEYAYDASGNRIGKATPDFTETYGFDQLSRLTEVERSGIPGRWRFEFDAVGNRALAQHNDSVTTAAFDERNRLLAEEGGGSLRVRGMLDEPGTVTVDGEAARMLEGNIFESTIQATPGTNTFTVEATDYSGNTESQTYEVEVTGTDSTYSYDANGNLIEKIKGGITWTYEWDAENRLIRVTRDGAEAASFAYDPLGRRVGKSAGGIDRTYLYDGMNILQEAVSDGATTDTIRYIHGPGIDEPLVRVAVETGDLRFYHADGLGSIVKITDDTGTAVQDFRYGPWGILEIGSGQSGYSFTGREWDPEVELYYFRARYLDPATGSFISEDPDYPSLSTPITSHQTSIRVNAPDPRSVLPMTVGGAVVGPGVEVDPNLYAYVRGNPVSSVDPDGRKARLPKNPSGGSWWTYAECSWEYFKCLREVDRRCKDKYKCQGGWYVYLCQNNSQGCCIDNFWLCNSAPGFLYKKWKKTCF